MSAAFVRNRVPMSPITSASAQDESGRDQLRKSETAVRLELQRRAIREQMQINDNMIREIDEHLVYVVQFKKEWLHHMRLMESERRTVSTEEATSRKRIEEGARVQWDGIMYSFLRPLRREQHSASVVAMSMGAGVRPSAREEEEEL